MPYSARQPGRRLNPSFGAGQHGFRVVRVGEPKWRVRLVRRTASRPRRELARSRCRGRRSRRWPGPERTGRPGRPLTYERHLGRRLAQARTVELGCRREGLEGCRHGDRELGFDLGPRPERRPFCGNAGLDWLRSAHHAWLAAAVEQTRGRGSSPRRTTPERDELYRARHRCRTRVHASSPTACCTSRQGAVRSTPCSRQGYRAGASVGRDTVGVVGSPRTRLTNIVRAEPGAKTPTANGMPHVIDEPAHTVSVESITAGARGHCRWSSRASERPYGTPCRSTTGCVAPRTTRRVVQVQPDVARSRALIPA